MGWLSRATLDIIGLAGKRYRSVTRQVFDGFEIGFNYDFEALDPSGHVNELSEAFNVLFFPQGGNQLFGFLQGIIPPLRHIVCTFILALRRLLSSVYLFQRTKNSRKAEVAQAVMDRIGRQLIAEKKAAIWAESREKGRDVEKKDVSGRDLLTLLIKANMATDIPDSQRLTDEEVLAREFLPSRL